MTDQNEVLRLRNLLAIAQAALATCEVHYSEFNQFEGSWDYGFSEEKVHAALEKVNLELGLPEPKKFRCN